MSDNRVKTDDKYFKEKFKLEARKIAAAASGMFKLARDRGITDKSSIMNRLFNEIGKTTTSYIGYRYGAIDNVLELRNILNESKKPSRMQAKKNEAKRSMLSELNSKISNSTPWLVEVNTTADGCGVFYTETGGLKKFVVPMMYSNHIKEIGSLGTNKVLVWSRPHHHDTYKCWYACYFTYSYNNGSRKYKSMDCFIMKDSNSGITYYHTDYRLCAMGMRRAIGRKIASRIGGS